MARLFLALTQTPATPKTQAMAPVGAAAAAPSQIAASSALSSAASYSPSLRLHPALRPSRRPAPSPSLAISAIAVPPLTAHVLHLARPLSRLLLASVFSIPARITAAAARAAPSPEQLAALRALFSAALASRAPSAYVQDPLQAFASGAASMIGLYSEILSVRCLLTWFPNIPWERQPFSALRNLCDPFLVLCRSIIPPVGAVDISPILAFTALGFLSTFLSGNPPPQML